MIEIEGFGSFLPDEYGALVGQNSCRVPCLDAEVRFLLEGYSGDVRQADFHEAMQRFVEIGRQVLSDASEFVFAYFTEIRDSGCTSPPDIKTPDRVWDFVSFGRDAVVSRRGSGDERIYISLECECAWEPEHGLQIVFREGREINKVGPFDGHLTNSDAFDDPALENTIYAG